MSLNPDRVLVHNREMKTPMNPDNNSPARISWQNSCPVSKAVAFSVLSHPVGPLRMDPGHPRRFRYLIPGPAPDLVPQFLLNTRKTMR